MTHVLDRMIEELDALAGALRRRDQNTLGGKTSTSERELYESAEESLRILRAEREGGRGAPAKNGPNEYQFDRYVDGKLMAQGGRVWAHDEEEAHGRVSVLFHEDGPRGSYVLVAEREGRRSEAVAAIEEIAGLLRCDIGHVADTLGTVREMLDEYSRLGSRITAWLDEARAEGRREERERVVAWLRDQSERLTGERMARPPYTGARDEDAVADALLYAIEDGDHWRGGEG